MASITAFDATKVAPAEAFDLIPIGDYVAMITASENKATKSGGEMLKLTVTIIEGQYKDRKVWAQLNLINANPKAVEIAQRELSSICHATNVLTLTDSAQLHNRPLVVKLGQERSEEWGDKNTVKGWKPLVKTAPLAPPTFEPSSSPSSPAPAWKAPTTPTAPTGATAPGAVGPDGIRLHDSDAPF
jgi:hypothetical protein